MPLPIDKLPPAPPPTPNGVPAPPKSPWPVGQLLDAVVVSRPNGQQALLRIDGELLRATTPPGMTPGQSLRLEVLPTAGGVPQLRILNQDDSGITPLARLLRASLPRQLPLNEAFERLAALRESDARLPAGVRDALTRLLASLPRSEQLSDANGLRAALLASGGQLEARLLRGEAPRRDLKKQLLQLLASDHGDTPGLKRPLEGALATLESRQGETLQSPARGETALLRVDLPLFSANGRPDLLRLDIDHEPPRDPDDAVPGWTLRLHLALAEYGPIDVNLRLKASRVSVDLYCERNETLARLTPRLPELETGLRGAGLEIGQLRIHPGRPARRAGETAGADMPALLDLRA